MCKSNERHKALQLVSSQLPPVRSCLQRSVEEGLSSSMKRALLEVRAVNLLIFLCGQLSSMEVQ